jgi:single-stranded-DNA-specific exonuclease
MPNKFLSAMLAKWGRGEKLTPHAGSWSIAPKINSVYRLNDAALKEQMFYAFADEADIDDTIKLLGRCHRQQSDTARQLYQDIQANLRCHRNFVIGVIPAEYKSYTGLVASKLANRYNKPAIVLREVDPTLWSGSFRSPVPLLSIINTSDIAQAQGHESSAGIVVKKADLGRFCQWLDEQQIDTTGDIEVAACLDVADITLELCEQIEQYGHLWGKDVDCPRFFTELTIPPNTMVLCGKAGNTFRFPPFIKFGCTDEEMAKFGTNTQKNVQLIYELSVNEYGGQRYPQAKIVDWEIEDVGESDESAINWDEIFK